MMKQALIKYPGERVRGIKVKDIEQVKTLIKAWFVNNGVRLGPERYIVISRPLPDSSVIAVALDACSFSARLDSHVSFDAPAPHLCKETSSPIVITSIPFPFSAQVVGIREESLPAIFEWICPRDVDVHENTKALWGRQEP